MERSVKTIILVALLVGGCQTYDPATQAICESACAQRQTCEPDAFWQQFGHAQECQLACENDWLSVRRDETPECERAWKQAFLCVGALSCEELAVWRAGDPHQDPSLPCAHRLLESELACTYECVDDLDCRGWERCAAGACVARSCETADDCPAGVWCANGLCSPL